MECVRHSQRLKGEDGVDAEDERNPRSKAATLRSIGHTLADLGELDLVSQFAAEAQQAHSRAPAYLFLGAAEGLIEARD